MFLKELRRECMKLNMLETVKKRNAGFTLIEVIISLVVSSILAAMLVTFLGTSMMKSARPVLIAQNGAYLNRIMDNMTADYKYQMTTAMQNGLLLSTGMSNFIAHLDTANYYADSSHAYTVTKKRIAFSGTPPTENVAEDTSSKILKVTVSYRDLTSTTIFTE
jgi:prepilin-type N-terminal cleavage/methylation domain-containing protein